MSKETTSRSKAAKQTTLTRRVRGGIGAVLVLALFMSAALLAVTVIMGGSVTQLSREVTPATRAAQEINQLLYSVQLDVTKFVQGTKSDLTYADTSFQSLDMWINRALEASGDVNQQARIIELRNMLSSYRQAFDMMQSSSTQLERDGLYPALSGLYDEMMNLTIPLSEESWNTLERMASWAMKLFLWMRIGSIVMLILFLVLGLNMVNVVGRALTRVSKQVNESSEEIRFRAASTAAAADEMAASAEQVTRALEEVASSVEQVTVGSSQSATSTQEISNLVGQIHRTIQVVAEGADQTLNAIQTFYKDISMTAEAVDRGNTVAESTSRAILTTVEAEQGASAGLQRLSTEMGRISQILASIKGISAQTELLSLNASIEAARAREHGRGFAVVADEIKKLSIQSAQSTEEIANIIEQINSVSEQLVNEIGQNIEASQAVSTQAMSLKDTFLGIARMVKNLMALMNRVVGTAQGQFDMTRQSSELSDKVLVSTEEIAAQIEQVSASMQELSSTVQEVLAANEEMRTNARNQAETSAQLNELADKVAEEVKELV